MVTLRQLEFALAVGKHLHFKQAASACNISQSALSLGILELEKQLGTPIFERNNKQVLITSIGEKILSRAGEILEMAHSLEQMAKAQGTPLSHPMSLGIIPTIAPFLLPKLLPALKRDYPQFYLTLSEKKSAVLLDEVRQGVLDSAIIALPFDTQGLHTFEFGKEAFYAIFASKPKGQSIDIASLLEHNLMLLGEGHCLTDQVRAACKLSQGALEAGVSDASLSTLIQMTRAGYGTTLVPKMALGSLEGVEALPLKDKGAHRTLAFVTRLNYARVDDIGHLCRICQRVLDGLL